MVGSPKAPWTSQRDPQIFPAPYQVFLMLPFAMSIIALVIMSRRAAYPQALMIPYRKGER